MPDDAPIKLLTFSTLYPNAVMPRHGIFVETRLRQLIGTGQVVPSVMAPVPWFPFTHSRFGHYARFAQVPRTENRYQIPSVHPRYLLLPKIGMNLAPRAIAAACLPLLQQRIRQGEDFDLIDAHYFYPDGVAAALLGQRLNKPVVISARGTDVNLIPDYAYPRKMILWATRQAAAIITVSAALRDKLIALGADAKKITVLRNGVDLDFFRPMDRAVQRAALGVTGPLLLSVGNLVPSKGHDITLRALALLPGVHLAIAGEGPEQQSLQKLAADLGVESRVSFLGNLPQAKLPEFYSAADAMVLASSREGWANVLLEAMACGTPVVATAVGGTPEVITDPAAGLLMRDRSPQALAEAVTNLLTSPPSRASTRQHAARYGWEEISQGQLQLFRRSIAMNKGS
ncbi:MAG: glycosyltransferase family 4 protein [Burkholderiales bacterium]